MVGPPRDVSTTRRGTAPGMLLAAARVLARDPHAIRFGPAFVRSLTSTKSPLEMRIPWLTYRAIEWLDQHVGPSASVFEYGSGGSTLFLAARAGQVTSVEHDRAWFDATSEALNELRIGNCRYLLEEPRPAPPGEAEIYLSSDAKYAGHTFRAYAAAIDDYDDASFDFVLVDGRARPACARHAAAKVRPGGFLIVDDAQRSIYAGVADELRNWHRLDFPGPAPQKIEASLTSAWQAPASR